MLRCCLHSCSHRVQRVRLYNHVNWGWDGKDNGYILSSIFDSSNMYLRDPSIYGSNTDVYNYERNIQYIEMYRPDTNNSTNQ